MTVLFRTDAEKLFKKYQSALSGLDSNIIELFGFEEPVLIEGGHYQGIWLECGPMESLIYGAYRPEVAVAGHRIFFKHQREDGYIPLRVTRTRINSSQLQQVVPIAATSLEVYKLVNDEAFLKEAYEACSKWDAWLSKHRDTRGTGLCEAFCEWDTGHDNSPRFAGIPRKCPDDDASICPPDIDVLPLLAPDLSASMYGGRVALAEMAKLLGKSDEALQWKEKAERIQQAILTYCFDPEDMCFYDLDRHHKFLRIKGDAMTRVLGEHVVDQDLFDEIFEKHITNPDAFWTPYPMPSIAVDDPVFDHDLPENSWGGASQCLTALRTPRWFEHYGKPSELVVLMERWVEALVRDSGFKQQMNPWTGEFNSTDDYSPAMCVLIDFIPRLYGIRKADHMLEWNCRIPENASSSQYQIETDEGLAELKQEKGKAVLILNGQQQAEITGKCRVITDDRGKLISILGTELKPTEISVTLPEGFSRTIELKGNETVKF